MRKIPLQFSFQTTLLTLMLAVLFTAVLLLGTAAYFNGRFAARNLGNQILSQAEARVSRHINHTLELAEAEAGTLGGLITNGWFDPDNHEHVTDYLLAALSSQPSLSYLSFGMPSGKYYHAFRDRDGTLNALWLIPESGGVSRLFEYGLSPDQERTVIRDVAESTHSPPYERPYYRAAAAAGKAIWTDSYVFLGSGGALDIPGVSHAIPVYNDNDLLGVLTADFDLYALSRFLREVNLGETGLTFLVEITSEDEPRVIAHPDAADPDPASRLNLTEPAPDGGGRVTIRAEQITDPRVTEFLRSLGRGLSVVPASLSLADIQIEGKRYVGGYRHLGREDGPDWIICMMFPDDEIFGDVHQMSKFMAALGVGGVIIAGLLSMLLSRRVGSMLGNIADETREIGKFELVAKQPVASRIKELNTLATAVEEMKTGLRSFGKYVPSDVVRQLVRARKEAKLGVETKELTIFFSDVAGFTSIAENLPHEVLVEMMGEYLEELSNIIIESGGTVDKYIGDAIMAFWNAPEPVENHAHRAVESALRCVEKLDELNTRWREQGRPELKTRIGINTGNALVGNFGSLQRMNYTVLGDSVNLAARLEGLNKFYGTELIISEDTFRAVKDHYCCRPLDVVIVKGKTQPTCIYEVIGRTSEVSPETKQKIALFEQALDAYLNREFETAISRLSSGLQLTLEDKAPSRLMQQCQQLLANPPDDDWVGSTALKEK